MYKSLVFINLLGLALASPMSHAKDNVNTIRRLFEYDDNASPACKQETEILKSCFKEVIDEFTQMSSDLIPTKEEISKPILDIRTALACTGEVTCSKSMLAKYLIETGVYAVEHIYGGGYECVNDHGLEFYLLICMMKYVQDENLPSSGLDPSSIPLKPVARCVAEQQKCRDSVKQEFLKGAMAFAELTDVSRELGKAFHNGDEHFVETFDKKFDSKEFDNLEL